MGIMSDDKLKHRDTRCFMECCGESIVLDTGGFTCTRCGLIIKNISEEPTHVLNGNRRDRRNCTAAHGATVVHPNGRCYRVQLRWDMDKGGPEPMLQKKL